jgi:hypothetical protein
VKSAEHSGQITGDFGQIVPEMAGVARFRHSEAAVIVRCVFSVTAICLRGERKNKGPMTVREMSNYLNVSAWPRKQAGKLRIGNPSGAAAR